MTDSAHDNYIDQFSDYHDGSLAEADAAELKEHLESCESCRAEYDSLLIFVRREISRSRIFSSRTAVYIFSRASR